MQELIYYFTHLAIIIGIYAILALGLNLVVGYTGLLSVMHAAFYGVGAYATALLMTQLGFNFFIATGLSVVIAIVLSFAIGLVLSRFDGDYYALGSLGFGVILYSVFLSWRGVTRGALGIPQIPKPELFGFEFSQITVFLLLVVVLAAGVYLCSRFVTRSSFGRVLMAIREDERAIQVFGYNTLYFKLTVFVIGAGIAAIAGALFASYITYINPSSFTAMESIYLLSIIILGGLASLRGSVLGAVFLVVLFEGLRHIGLSSDMAAHMREALYGVILVALMLYRPQGLVGKYKL
ncbi:MAG: branched-chain amino acid ABC transporter permease [Candidatus Kaiserbacteria bacterium]|nr:branched-chain amino acid ABC transporter permease [Candidatus Kaiserbacteria bacterium]